MARPTLSAGNKSSLRRSSRGAVEQAFRSLKYFINRNRWIGVTNRYRMRCVENLKRDTQRGSSLAHSHLAQYIASSAPLHCADGWSYLGRAIMCHNQGDNDTARHLAYYAELRGAISLLASEGIGIFDKRHFILETSGRCVKLSSSQGTHVVTWLALEYWANLSRSAHLLGEIISAGGISLHDWLSAFLTTSSLRPIGRKWLISWGLDLKRLSDDRHARNEASYRPTRLSSKSHLVASEASEFLRALWAMYEPSPQSRFEILDRHLIRLSLEQAFEATTGKGARGNSDFIDRISSAVNAITPIGCSADEWVKFLTGSVEADTPALIVEGGGNAPLDAPRHHIQVIARAALLLRFATGASAMMLKATGFERNDLEFWWKSFGEDRGFWEPGNEPIDFTDLWADIEVAVQQAEQWEINSRGTQASYAHWRRQSLDSNLTLVECERIALWGLGL